MVAARAARAPIAVSPAHTMSRRTVRKCFDRTGNERSGAVIVYAIMPVTLAWAGSEGQLFINP
jgi:hypothetical protein